MKIKDLIKQLNTFDPEMEILATDTPLIGDGSMQGYARSVVNPWVHYVTSIPTPGNNRRYYPFKTKRYNKAVYIITT